MGGGSGKLTSKSSCTLNRPKRRCSVYKCKKRAKIWIDGKPYCKVHR